MIDRRDEYIRRELEQYRAILWALEHREEVRHAGRSLALWLVEDGAGVSEQAARCIHDPELDLANWTEDDARRLRRAIVDDEAWLVAPADALHPAMARALGPVLADLERTNGPRFRFEHEPVEPGSNPMVVAYDSRGVGTGIWVDAFGDLEDTIDFVTYQMHDPILEASDGGWPSCPVHSATHRLVLCPGGWQCYVTGEHIASLGRLGDRQMNDPAQLDHSPHAIDCLWTPISDASSYLTRQRPAGALDCS